MVPMNVDGAVDIAKAIASWKTVRVADLVALCESVGLQAQRGVHAPYGREQKFVRFEVADDPQWRLVFSGEHVERGLLADSGHVLVTLEALERWGKLSPKDAVDCLRPSPWVGDLAHLAHPVTADEAPAIRVGRLAQELIAELRANGPLVSESIATFIAVVVDPTVRLIRGRSA